MSCTRLGNSPDPASPLHALRCSECRRASDADAKVALALKCAAAEPIDPDGLARVFRALSLDAGSVRIVEPTDGRVARRRALATILPALLLVLTVQAWLWYIDINPSVRIPETPPPTPNAFSTFEAAANAISKDELTGKALNDAREEAHASAIPACSLAETQKALESNALALRLLRQGFRQEYRDRPIRSFAQPLPHYAGFRMLARLLSLEARYYERKGDIARANASDLDAIQLGMTVHRGAAIIGRLVGNSCASIGRAGLWARLDTMGEQDARQAALRLERLTSSRVPLEETFREEKYAAMAGFLEILRQPRYKWFDTLTPRPDSSSSFALPRTAWLLASLRYSKTELLDRCRRSHDRLIESARRFPRERPADQPAEGGGLHEFEALFEPVHTSLIYKDAASDATNRMLCLSLAVRAYTARHGAPPDIPEKLVTSGYLRAVPADPFSGAGLPLGYRVRNGKPVIYSVGPDGRDDGGKAIYDPNRTRGQEYALEANSKGDIVAGVNMP